LNDGSSELTPPAKKIAKGKKTKRLLSTEDTVQSDSKNTKCIPPTSSTSKDEECANYCCSQASSTSN